MSNIHDEWAKDMDDALTKNINPDTGVEENGDAVSFETARNIVKAAKAYERGILTSEELIETSRRKLDWKPRPDHNNAGMYKLYARLRNSEFWVGSLHGHTPQETVLMFARLLRRKMNIPEITVLYRDVRGILQNTWAV